MQPNGGTAEAQNALIGNGNDQLPDISGATTVIAGQAHQMRPTTSPNQQQQHQQQQQQQHHHQQQTAHHLPYHQANMAAPMTGSGVEPNMHSHGHGHAHGHSHSHGHGSGGGNGGSGSVGGSGYGRSHRHGSSYQQQHHMQQYHPHSNKYNNPRGDSGFNTSRGGAGSGGSGSGGYAGGDSFLHGVGTGGGGGGAGGHSLGYGSRHDHHNPQHHQHSQSHHHQHHSSARGSGGGGGHISGQSQNSSYHPANTSHAIMAAHSGLVPQGTVMMVYGLHPERVNCDRLFNLFCLYGNVVRVKFLRTKEGCAMVQMGDILAVDRCVSSLNKMTLFGNELQISYSKQAFLHDVMQPFTLPDGSPSFKDFMGNKNNRFKNPEVACKNRILPPSQVLHFFNAPFGITEDELSHLFKQTSGHEPVSLKIFTPKTEATRSFSGLMTFRDPAEATEALVLCNHLSIPKPGAPHPYILRLCFSPPMRMSQQPASAYVPPAADN